ncbi:zinc finger protein 43-like [Cyrtonyx montezumae]|uniref:zinc finger protein 43-like n=1 Tax=Cyrtonyx montezumae TaxID=9017 RepID=UPI0032DA6E97
MRGSLGSAASQGLNMAASVERAKMEEKEEEEECECQVFEVLLPVTVFVLSDEEFLQAEEHAALVPELEEGQRDAAGDGCVPEGSVSPAGSDGLNVREEHRATANESDSVEYSEGKWSLEDVRNNSELPMSNGISEDAQSHSAAVLPSLCRTEPAEMSEVSNVKDHDDDDTLQKIPLLSAADCEGRDETTDTCSQVTSPAACRDEELAGVLGVLPGESQEKQPEVHTEMEAALKVEDADSLRNGDSEAKSKTSKGSKFEYETLSPALECGLKEEPELDSVQFINGYSTSRELEEDVGKLEINASISALSTTTEEHIYKSLTTVFKKRCRQQRIISPPESPNEIQGQQETWLNNSISIKPSSEASCSRDKREKINFNCRFCSCAYKSSALLKRHIYSAHKNKKTHKCSFCKRTFFFSVNLKNHLKLHKMTRLQKERKKRMNARRVRQRTEERKSERKKKESKYEKYFIKIERDFTSLGVPVIFSCKFCFFGSSNPKIFVHHMKAHKERPPYQCPQCDYSSPSLSYVLNHMYWHAGYKLYKCRFCTFFSPYFASMVRHRYMHTGHKPYSCEFCQSAFTSLSGLKRHRRLHVGEETCKLEFGNGRKRTQRPAKNYTCDECNVLFYTRGHLNFHKKCHGQHKVSANGYASQSNEYLKSKGCKVDSDSKGCVLSNEDDNLTGGTCKILASEVDFVQAGDVQDSKKTRLARTFTKNSHVKNISPVFGSRSEVLDPYRMETVVYKEDLLFSPGTSHSQMEDNKSSAAYYTSEDTRPSSLSVFKLHKCKHCDYATAVHSNFKLHLKTHANKGPFVCQECNKAFKTSKRLQRHRLLHVKDQYELSHYFYADNHLKNFELRREMQVGLCPKRDFGSSEGFSDVCSMLPSEVYGEQADIKREKGHLLAQRQFYQCVECEYSTYILSNLKLHVRTHTGERPYSCNVCQKMFRTSSHLKRHQVLHCNTEHLKCRKCDYSTNKWPSLKKHLASHAVSESSSVVSLYELKPLPFKTYTCEECGYTTVHHGNFKQHLRIHTGEKPFKCGQCGCAFRTSSHLKRHLLTHVKFQCRRCDFSSVNKYAFQKHIKMHKKNHTSTASVV